MKKILMMLIVAGMILFAGCSSNVPVITEVSSIDVKFDTEEEKLSYKLQVKYAIDKEIENPTSGIMKITFDEDGYEKELEWGFSKGQQNDQVKFGMAYGGYIPGQAITGKVEMIQGTKVLDTKPFEVVYNE